MPIGFSIDKAPPLEFAKLLENLVSEIRKL